MSGLTPERLEEIRADDEALVSDLGSRPQNRAPWYLLQGNSENLATTFRRAAIDRRDLLAEVDRLRAQSSDLFDECVRLKKDNQRLRAQVAAVEQVLADWKGGEEPVHHQGYIYRLETALASCDNRPLRDAAGDEVSP